MISAVQWVRRGVARREPLQYELTPEELANLQASVDAEADFHGARTSEDEEEEDEDEDEDDDDDDAGGAAQHRDADEPDSDEEDAWEDDNAMDEDTYAARARMRPARDSVSPVYGTDLIPSCPPRRRRWLRGNVVGRPAPKKGKGKGKGPAVATAAASAAAVATTASFKKRKGKGKGASNEIDPELARELDLDHYDDDDGKPTAGEAAVLRMFSATSLRGLQYHGSNEEDPYITLKDEVRRGPAVRVLIVPASERAHAHELTTGPHRAVRCRRRPGRERRRRRRKGH